MSLVEVLIAGALMLLLLILAEACVRYLWNNSRKMRTGLEPRQQIRAFFLNLRRDLRASSYLFLGYSGSLMGESVNVPLAGGVGDSLLFAIPGDDSLDAEYTVCMLVARPRSVADPNNPNARELFYHRFRPRRSVPANTPGALVPATLLQGSSRTFDVYLPAGPVTGSDPPFSLRISPNGSGVQVMTRFVVRPQRGKVISERHDAYFTLRNNV